jgi:hypothetical protein
VSARSTYAIFGDREAVADAKVAMEETVGEEMILGFQPIRKS